jgi:uncharacterized protein
MSMRHANHGAIILVLALCTFSLNAQQKFHSTYPQASLPETEVRYLKSAIVGDEFEISVALPFNYGKPDTTYPVLYSTDANLMFAASTQTARLMQMNKVLPEVIHVGIGYRLDSLTQGLPLRSRDLTPTFVPDSSKGSWPTGGAEKFLRFIKEELMPFINKNYRTSPDAGYAGFSYGGLFGLYVLFHEPQTFQRYIIGSPSVWFDSLVTLRCEAEYARTHRDLPARIFMSVGQLEERPGSTFKMVTNMKRLADSLQSRHYPNLRLETYVFEGEIHVSAPGATISRGLRSIYKK